MLVQTDARQHAMFSRVERPPTAGAGARAHDRQYLQHIAERELRVGVEENAAAGGTAIIMDPQHRRDPRAGELADVQPERLQRRGRRRAAQPRDPGLCTSRARRSRSSPRRPRSKSGVIATDRSGRLRSRASSRSAAASIRDMHHYGMLPFTDVIVKSSNVGAIKVGLRLGPERLGRYISRFGFGQTLAPDFRGENAGIVWNPARLDPTARWRRCRWDIRSA